MRGNIIPNGSSTTNGATFNITQTFSGQPAADPVQEIKKLALLYGV